MVPRQAEDADRADRDVVRRRRHDDRPAHDRLDVEDRDLRLADHRRRHDGAELAGVGDREGAVARRSSGAQRPGARAPASSRIALPSSSAESSSCAPRITGTISPSASSDTAMPRLTSRGA